MESRHALIILTGLLGIPAAVFDVQNNMRPVVPTQATTAPVWAKPHHFWYRKDLPSGPLWINVDAEHGVKEPLFDHQRLAIEMSLRSGSEYTPTTLPFADPALQFVVKYDGSNAYIQEGAMAIEFIMNAQHWRCELQIKWDWNKVPPTDYECLPRRSAAAGLVLAPQPVGIEGAPVLSPDGKWQAFVQNHNVVVRAAAGGAAKPLTSNGVESDGWQAGSLRWSRDSQTLHAYKVKSQVWLSDGVSGNVKSMIAAGEWLVR